MWCNFIFNMLLCQELPLKVYTDQKDTMKILHNEKEYICYLEFALSLVGGKWKSLVLWHLREVTLRYSEIKKEIPCVTQKMLTQTLRDLENNQLITRKVYPVVPPKVEYTITEHGKKLIPIFQSLHEWSQTVSKDIATKIE